MTISKIGKQNRMQKINTKADKNSKSTQKQNKIKKQIKSNIRQKIYKSKIFKKSKND